MKYINNGSKENNTLLCHSTAVENRKLCIKSMVE